MQQNPRQTFMVNGKFGWHVDGAGSAPVAAAPEEAERWQLEMWLNPHGFLKAARLPGANPVAVWRWELGEMGRDGPTTVPEKVTVVSIQMLGKYRVDATINKENMLQRIHTWVADPVLGDMNYEHEFTNESYVDAGSGVRFPTGWHSHHGWDDNYNTQTISAGHNGFGGSFKDVRANACDDPVTVPDSVRQATFPVRVETAAAGQRCVPARGFVAQQRRDRVQGLHRGRRSAAGRGAEPRGDRGDRAPHPEQADPVSGEHAPALRSHRRASNLPAHRRDRSSRTSRTTTSTIATC